MFVTSYYTFEQTRNLNSFLLGGFFLASGIVDAFHTLSFLGMPAFFIENSTANRATTFWVITRLIMASGLLMSALIPKTKRINTCRIMVLPVVTVCTLIFLAVTYRPEAIPVMYSQSLGLTPAKIYAEYLIIIIFAAALAGNLADYSKNKSQISLSLAAAIIFNIFSEMAFVSYGSVYDIYNYLGHVYKVIASYIIFKAIFVHNVQQPYIELSKAKTELTGYVENLDRLVEHRTRQLTAMNQKFKEDLEYARDIQKAILPVSLPERPGVAFSTRYFPAEQVSGDFYSIFELDEDNIGFYIGDVSGHGVPAAMLTIFMKQSIKVKNSTGTAEGELFPPSAVMQNVYDAFNNTNFSDEMYVVMLYGIFNIKTSVLTYSSAGLNVHPIIQESGGLVRRLEIKGFPICKIREIFAGEFHNHTLRLNSGDRILFYTDGLIESESTGGERYTEERLLTVLENSCGAKPEELAGAIENNLFGFIGDALLKDDITFFVIQAGI